MRATRRRARPSSMVASMRGSMPASAIGGGPRRDGVGQEAVQDAGQVEAGQHTRDLVGGEHVGGDEAAERGAEPLLLVRDDGGVRDRDAERMAEQRGDREPVGDAADEAGLGGGLEQVGGEPGGQRVAAERQRGHQDQQRGGEGPVAAQRAPGFGVGVRGDSGGRAGLDFTEAQDAHGWSACNAAAERRGYTLQVGHQAALTRGSKGDL